MIDTLSNITIEDTRIPCDVSESLIKNYSWIGDNIDCALSKYDLFMNEDGKLGGYDNDIQYFTEKSEYGVYINTLENAKKAAKRYDPFYFVKFPEIEIENIRFIAAWGIITSPVGEIFQGSYLLEYPLSRHNRTSPEEYMKWFQSESKRRSSEIPLHIQLLRKTNIGNIENVYNINNDKVEEGSVEIPLSNTLVKKTGLGLDEISNSNDPVNFLNESSGYDRFHRAYREIEEPISNKELFSSCFLSSYGIGEYEYNEYLDYFKKAKKATKRLRPFHWTKIINPTGGPFMTLLSIITSPRGKILQCNLTSSRSVEYFLSKKEYLEWFENQKRVVDLDTPLHLVLDKMSDMEEQNGKEPLYDNQILLESLTNSYRDICSNKVSEPTPRSLFFYNVDKQKADDLYEEYLEIFEEAELSVKRKTPFYKEKKILFKSEINSYASDFVAIVCLYTTPYGDIKQLFTNSPINRVKDLETPYVFDKSGHNSYLSWYERILDSDKNLFIQKLSFKTDSIIPSEEEGLKNRIVDEDLESEKTSENFVHINEDKRGGWKWIEYEVDHPTDRDSFFNSFYSGTRFTNLDYEKYCDAFEKAKRASKRFEPFYVQEDDRSKKQRGVNGKSTRSSVWALITSPSGKIYQSIIDAFSPYLRIPGSLYYFDQEEYMEWFNEEKLNVPLHMVLSAKTDLLTEDNNTNNELKKDNTWDIVNITESLNAIGRKSYSKVVTYPMVIEEFNNRFRVSVHDPDNSYYKEYLKYFEKARLSSKNKESFFIERKADYGDIKSIFSLYTDPYGKIHQIAGQIFAEANPKDTFAFSPSGNNSYNTWYENMLNSDPSLFTARMNYKMKMQGFPENKDTIRDSVHITESLGSGMRDMFSRKVSIPVGKDFFYKLISAHILDFYNEYIKSFDKIKSASKNKKPLYIEKIFRTGNNLLNIPIFAMYTNPYGDILEIIGTTSERALFGCKENDTYVFDKEGSNSYKSWYKEILKSDENLCGSELSTQVSDDLEEESNSVNEDFVHKIGDRTSQRPDINTEARDSMCEEERREPLVRITSDPLKSSYTMRGNSLSKEQLSRLMTLHTMEVREERDIFDKMYQKYNDTVDKCISKVMGREPFFDLSVFTVNSNNKTIYYFWRIYSGISIVYIDFGKTKNNQEIRFSGEKRRQFTNKREYSEWYFKVFKKEMEEVKGLPAEDSYLKELSFLSDIREESDRSNILLDCEISPLLESKEKECLLLENISYLYSIRPTPKDQHDFFNCFSIKYEKVYDKKESLDNFYTGYFNAMRLAYSFLREKKPFFREGGLEYVKESGETVYLMWRVLNGNTIISFYGINKSNKRKVVFPDVINPSFDFNSRSGYKEWFFSSSSVSPEDIYLKKVEFDVDSILERSSEKLSVSPEENLDESIQYINQILTYDTFKLHTYYEHIEIAKAEFNEYIKSAIEAKKKSNEYKPYYIIKEIKNLEYPNANILGTRGFCWGVVSLPTGDIFSDISVIDKDTGDNPLFQEFKHDFTNEKEYKKWFLDVQQNSPDLLRKYLDNRFDDLVESKENINESFVQSDLKLSYPRFSGLTKYSNKEALLKYGEYEEAFKEAEKCASKFKPYYVENKVPTPPSLTGIVGFGWGVFSSPSGKVVTGVGNILRNIKKSIFSSEYQTLFTNEEEYREWFFKELESNPATFQKSLERKLDKLTEDKKPINESVILTQMASYNQFFGLNYYDNKESSAEYAKYVIAYRKAEKCASKFNPYYAENKDPLLSSRRDIVGFGWGVFSSPFGYVVTSIGAIYNNLENSIFSDYYTFTNEEEYREWFFKELESNPLTFQKSLEKKLDRLVEGKNPINESVFSLTYFSQLKFSTLTHYMDRAETDAEYKIYRKAFNEAHKLASKSRPYFIENKVQFQLNPYDTHKTNNVGFGWGIITLPTGKVLSAAGNIYNDIENSLFDGFTFNGEREYKEWFLKEVKNEPDLCKEYVSNALLGLEENISDNESSLSYSNNFRVVNRNDINEGRKICPYDCRPISLEDFSRKLFSDFSNERKRMLEFLDSNRDKVVSEWERYTKAYETAKEKSIKLKPFFKEGILPIFDKIILYWGMISNPSLIGEVSSFIRLMESDSVLPFRKNIPRITNGEGVDFSNELEYKKWFYQILENEVGSFSDYALMRTDILEGKNSMNEAVILLDERLSFYQFVATLSVPNEMYINYRPDYNEYSDAFDEAKRKAYRFRPFYKEKFYPDLYSYWGIIVDPTGGDVITSVGYCMNIDENHPFKINFRYKFSNKEEYLKWFNEKMNSGNGEYYLRSLDPALDEDNTKILSFEAKPVNGGCINDLNESLLYVGKQHMGVYSVLKEAGSGSLDSYMRYSKSCEEAQIASKQCKPYYKQEILDGISKNFYVGWGVISYPDGENIITSTGYAENESACIFNICLDYSDFRSEINFKSEAEYKEWFYNRISNDINLFGNAVDYRVGVFENVNSNVKNVSALYDYNTKILSFEAKPVNGGCINDLNESLLYVGKQHMGVHSVLKETGSGSFDSYMRYSKSCEEAQIASKQCKPYYKQEILDGISKNSYVGWGVISYPDGENIITSTGYAENESACIFNRYLDYSDFRSEINFKSEAEYREWFYNRILNDINLFGNSVDYRVGVFENVNSNVKNVSALYDYNTKILSAKASLVNEGNVATISESVLDVGKVPITDFYWASEIDNKQGFYTEYLESCKEAQEASYRYKPYYKEAVYGVGDRGNPYPTNPIGWGVISYPDGENIITANGFSDGCIFKNYTYYSGLRSEINFNNEAEYREWFNNKISNDINLFGDSVDRKMDASRNTNPSVKNVKESVKILDENNGVEIRGDYGRKLTKLEFLKYSSFKDPKLASEDYEKYVKSFDEAIRCCKKLKPFFEETINVGSNGVIYVWRIFSWFDNEIFQILDRYNPNFYGVDIDIEFVRKNYLEFYDREDYLSNFKEEMENINYMDVVNYRIRDIEQNPLQKRLVKDNTYLDECHATKGGKRFEKEDVTNNCVFNLMEDCREFRYDSESLRILSKEKFFECSNEELSGCEIREYDTKKYLFDEDDYNYYVDSVKESIKAIKRFEPYITECLCPINSGGYEYNEGDRLPFFIVYVTPEFNLRQIVSRSLNPPSFNDYEYSYFDYFEEESKKLAVDKHTINTPVRDADLHLFFYEMGESKGSEPKSDIRIFRGSKPVPRDVFNRLTRNFFEERDYVNHYLRMYHNCLLSSESGESFFMNRSSEYYGDICGWFYVYSDGNGGVVSAIGVDPITGIYPYIGFPKRDSNLWKHLEEDYISWLYKNMYGEGDSPTEITDRKLSGFEKNSFEEISSVSEEYNTPEHINTGFKKFINKLIPLDYFDKLTMHSFPEKEYYGDYVRKYREMEEFRADNKKPLLFTFFGNRKEYDFTGCVILYFNQNMDIVTFIGVDTTQGSYPEVGFPLSDNTLSFLNFSQSYRNWFYYVESNGNTTPVDINNDKLLDFEESKKSTLINPNMKMFIGKPVPESVFNDLTKNSFHKNVYKNQYLKEYEDAIKYYNEKRDPYITYWYGFIENNSSGCYYIYIEPNHFDVVTVVGVDPEFGKFPNVGFPIRNTRSANEFENDYLDWFFSKTASGGFTPTEMTDISLRSFEESIESDYGTTSLKCAENETDFYDIVDIYEKKDEYSNKSLKIFKGGIVSKSDFYKHTKCDSTYFYSSYVFKYKNMKKMNKDIPYLSYNYYGLSSVGPCFYIYISFNGDLVTAIGVDDTKDVMYPYLGFPRRSKANSKYAYFGNDIVRSDYENWFYTCKANGGENPVDLANYSLRDLEESKKEDEEKTKLEVFYNKKISEGDESPSEISDRKLRVLTEIKSSLEIEDQNLDVFYNVLLSKEEFEKLLELESHNIDAWSEAYRKYVLTFNEATLHASKKEPFIISEYIRYVCWHDMKRYMCYFMYTSPIGDVITYIGWERAGKNNDYFSCPFIGFNKSSRDSRNILPSYHAWFSSGGESPSEIANRKLDSLINESIYKSKLKIFYNKVPTRDEFFKAIEGKCDNFEEEYKLFLKVVEKCKNYSKVSRSFHGFKYFVYEGSVYQSIRACYYLYATPKGGFVVAVGLDDMEQQDYPYVGFPKKETDIRHHARFGDQYRKWFSNSEEDTPVDEIERRLTELEESKNKGETKNSIREAQTELSDFNFSNLTEEQHNSNELKNRNYSKLNIVYNKKLSLDGFIQKLGIQDKLERYENINTHYELYVNNYNEAEINSREKNSFIQFKTLYSSDISPCYCIYTSPNGDIITAIGIDKSASSAFYPNIGFGDEKFLTLSKIREMYNSWFYGGGFTPVQYANHRLDSFLESDGKKEECNSFTEDNRCFSQEVNENRKVSKNIKNTTLNIFCGDPVSEEEFYTLGKNCFTRTEYDFYLDKYKKAKIRSTSKDSYIDYGFSSMIGGESRRGFNCVFTSPDGEVFSSVGVIEVYKRNQLDFGFFSLKTGPMVDIFSIYDKWFYNIKVNGGKSPIDLANDKLDNYGESES